MSNRQHDWSNVIALDRIRKRRPESAIRNCLFVAARLDGQWLFMEEYDEKDSSAPYKFVREFLADLPYPITGIQVPHDFPSEALVQIASPKGIEVRYSSISSPQFKGLIEGVVAREIRAQGL